jgi:hypothetical protein
MSVSTIWQTAKALLFRELPTYDPQSPYNKLLSLIGFTSGAVFFLASWVFAKWWAG